MFSLNVTLPIFIIIVAGGFLKRIGLLNDGFCAVADKFVFKAALPVQLFQDIAAADGHPGWAFRAKFVAFWMIATTGMFAATWILGAVFLKDKSMAGRICPGRCPGFRRDSGHCVCRKYIRRFRHDPHDDRGGGTAV